MKTLFERMTKAQREFIDQSVSLLNDAARENFKVPQAGVPTRHSFEMGGRRAGKTVRGFYESLPPLPAGQYYEFRNEISDSRDLLSPELAAEVDKAIKDMAAYGMHITKDGKRVDPHDFFATPEEQP